MDHKLSDHARIEMAVVLINSSRLEWLARITHPARLKNEVARIIDPGRLKSEVARIIDAVRSLHVKTLYHGGVAHEHLS